MQQAIDHLRDQVKKLIDKNAKEVEDDLDEALVEIVREKSPFIASRYEEGSFARVFWDAQQKAASVKNTKSMRWHPLMIRWCLYLRHLSSSAYETIRESNVIKLPSQRTLRDYTYYTKATMGFSADVDEQILKAAKLDSCPERVKYIIILMDEMHIKEGLVYDKHTGILYSLFVFTVCIHTHILYSLFVFTHTHIVFTVCVCLYTNSVGSITGFVQLGDINSHLASLEHQLDDDQLPEQLANSMLVIFVRGLFSKLNFAYVQFPCTSLSGDKLYDPF